MPAVAKNRAAAEAANTFKAQANAIRAELLDTTRTFTSDEVVKRTAEINALELRFASANSSTPEDEIEDQGGDALVRRNAPGRDDATDIDSNGVSRRSETAHQREVAELRTRVEQAFGGPNSLILALARSKIQPLDTRQQRVLNAITEFQKRTIIGTASDSSGGEYLLPLQQVASIFSAQLDTPGIFDQARRYPVSGRTLRIPYLVQDDGDVTRPMSGFAAVTIVGEAAEKPTKQPSFDQRLLTVYKWAAYTEFGDEMLADDFTGDLSPTVQDTVGRAVVGAINESVTMDGTGTAMPLGAFNNANNALYKVTRDDQNEFNTVDAFEMYARHVLGPKSRWYIHPSVLPSFMNLTLAGTTLVTTMRDLNGTPQMQLLGIPVVVTPLVSVLGAQGDVCLGNADFYALAVRTALTIQSSIHYQFRNDVTAYRFFARAGGLPIPTGTYSYKSTASTKDYAVSPFVVLDDVYAS
jgi:HK97 family phage major capsid protein